MPDQWFGEKKALNITNSLIKGLLYVAQLHVGEGEAVHVLRVRGIDLKGPA